MLGLGACKSQKSMMRSPMPVEYGAPPVIYVEDTIYVERQELKVVYGPPVVMTYTPDWHNASPDADGVYDIAEVMPQFPGGEDAMERWLAENRNYPEEIRNQGIWGSVMVSFIVRESGTIDGVSVFKSVHPQLDAEAVRVVKSMPQWTPGMLRGKAVAVRYFIPVEFR